MCIRAPVRMCIPRNEFIIPRVKIPKHRSKQFVDTVDTPQSLSIIYRRSDNSTKDKLVKTMRKSQGIPIVMDAAEDSLDLIIPSKANFDALSRTLGDLLAFYQEEEPCANPDYSLIQYHLVDMGKSMGEAGCLASCSDWVALCKRLNAPVSKGEATAIYRAFCESLAISNSQTEGLQMFEVARLLEVLRQRGLDSAARKGKGGGGAVRDPRKMLFEKITKSESGESVAVSAEKFLAFVHEEQKETDMTLHDVKDLFYQLNGHRVSPQLDDVLSIFSGYTKMTTKEGVSWEREYITSEAFGRYLLLESNDVFDPERSSPLDRCVQLFQTLMT